ncbi:Phospholipase_D-nuclease N-terminal [Thermoflavifilum thermophilum]|uniref:Phospholipase_D-nuclease N-terminal n=2 Tax=Thermoflavifilum thermophilum TaxID=1393122 RepID=A0A1I7NJZ2_9BACT|nr:Phospholipase_D-nuclease N-terminal [Thermoflavifilum thermophilum]
MHFMILLLLGWGLWGLLTLILWIWALVDIIKSRFNSDTTKIIWIVVVILLPLLGSILYLIIGRSQRVSS